MPQPTTLFEKLWQQHRVVDLHERTGAIALESLKQAGRPLAPIGKRPTQGGALAQRGEHSRPIPQSLGIDAARIEELNQAGIVA